MAIVAPRPAADRRPDSDLDLDLDARVAGGRDLEGRSGASPSSRPDLRIVGRRRRWPAVVGGFALTLVMVAMLGAAVFHTQLAERQLTIDQLERDVRDERRRFDELRRDRAVLRSPQRIGVAALELGMVHGETSRFVEVDAARLATQIAAAGVADDDTRRIILDADPLDQFRDVKAVSVEAP
ncbi:hypothetical protein [Ilumatobacter sp.]|uniref:hypothetical protein n=1 Tax=Ilumatobacter sp. TaxID=1967498 RepID=UPI003B522E9B